MADPQGGLTLLFTDIEGSTLLLRELKGSYGLLLRVHQRMLERSFDDHHGRSMGSEGDSLFYVFPNARDAVAAAVTAQRESSTTAGQKAFDSGCGSASTADR